MEPTLTPSIIEERRAAALAAIEVAHQAIAAANRNIEDRTAEIGDLDAAARVMDRLPPQEQSQTFPKPILPDEAASDFQLDFDAKEPVESPYKANTNKAVMWLILKDAVNPWMTANQIQDDARDSHEMRIPMSSISPALSEMKKEGTIERKGWLVALASRVKENEPPKGKPSGGSETALDAQ